jgi:hypothetical protein
MRLLPTTSTAARTSLGYITAGAMLVIWMGVWGVYLVNNAPERHGLYYLCIGLLITGFALIVIGLATGRIGSAARPADTVRAVLTPPPAADPRTPPIAAVTNPVPIEAPAPLALNQRD